VIAATKKEKTINEKKSEKKIERTVPPDVSRPKLQKLR
jgi:hypothetical protein